MFTSRGSSWGPSALPGFLRSQLATHGFEPDDAGRCARLINEHHGGAAAASLFVDLGSCKFLEADIDGAIAAWRHAIASQHDAPAGRALLNLGLLHEHLHLHERALELFARVAERDVEPYVVPAAMASARSQVALGENEQAMETMARLAQRAMADRPEGSELIEVLYGLGDVAEHAGRLDRAERAWRVAAASPPSDIQQQAAARLIQLLVRQGQSHSVATAAITSGLGGQEASLALLENAELLVRIGDVSLAAGFLAAIDAEELSVDDRFRFVDVNLMAGAINEAIDELETLLDHEDQRVQARALFSLGRVYVSYDMVDPAVSMFQRAIATDDPYWVPAASLALGDLLASSGDYGPANEYWSYAKAGAVPVLAERAQQRIDEPHPDPVPLDEVRGSGVAGSGVARSGVAESQVVEPQVISLDEIDADVDADAGSGVVESQVVEPQVISLDEIDAGADADAGVVEPLISLDEIDADPEVNGSHSTDALADPESEPVLIVLDDIEDSSEDDEASTAVFGAAGHDAHETAPSQTSYPQTRPPSTFGAFVDGRVIENPYAALAPDGHANDVAPTTRNPYAELAPNVSGNDFDPPDDVEPGDWESMLGDPLIDQHAEPKKSSSAFSRYT